MKKTITLLIISCIGANLVIAQPKPERPLPPELKEQADAIKASVEAGEITHDQAKAKINELLEQNKPEVGGEKPEVEIQRPAKPELSDELKESLSQIKADQKKLHESMKEKLADLGEGATKEEMREAIEAFKQENKEKFEAIKAAHESIRESMEAARPEKPERPELTADLKLKVEALKEKHKELHTARKELHEQLKDASEEEKQELIAEFKENNKAKHQEIKTQSKEIKEEIRALVETEATRTSDL